MFSSFAVCCTILTSSTVNHESLRLYFKTYMSAKIEVRMISHIYYRILVSCGRISDAQFRIFQRKPRGCMNRAWIALISIYTYETGGNWTITKKLRRTTNWIKFTSLWFHFLQYRLSTSSTKVFQNQYIIIMWVKRDGASRRSGHTSSKTFWQRYQ